VLAFILRGAGGTAVSTAFVLANVVISPLLFVGAGIFIVTMFGSPPITMRCSSRSSCCSPA